MANEVLRLNYLVRTLNWSSIVTDSESLTNPSKHRCDHRLLSTDAE